MEDDLKRKFEEIIRPGIGKSILNSVYRKPFANRYLARFAKFALENRGHYIIENIAEDCLNEFFINNLLHYKQVHKVPFISVVP